MDISILQALVRAPLILKMINIYLLTTAYQFSLLCSIIYILCFLQLMVSQVKAEMEKTLHWLVPVASNTNK